MNERVNDRLINAIFILIRDFCPFLFNFCIFFFCFYHNPAYVKNRFSFFIYFVSCNMSSLTAKSNFIVEQLDFPLCFSYAILSRGTRESILVFFLPLLSLSFCTRNLFLAIDQVRGKIFRFPEVDNLARCSLPSQSTAYGLLSGGAFILSFTPRSLK